VIPAPTIEQRLAERIRPSARPLMFNRWEHLLFLHWLWDAADLQRRLPHGLYVDSFEGQAYLGLVPFRMRQVRFVHPLLGWACFDFLETNVRTYVYDERGRPGVWFFALLCNHWPSVRSARTLYGLNYLDERMSFGAGEQFDYSCGTARFEYAAQGDASESQPGTLEFFLVERYRLFSQRRPAAALRSARVFHLPYRISPARLDTYGAQALQRCGFAMPDRAPELAHYSAAVDVDIFAPTLLQAAS
jgi:uncharacterized protein YqjF (DUF2071 family)